MTNRLLVWLGEKIAVEALERAGRLPEGTGKAIAAYTVWSFTPRMVQSRLIFATQYGIGRFMVAAGIPGSSSYKPGTFQPSSRNLRADTSGGRVRGPLPGARPAVVNYRVPRIGGGPPMGVSIFAPALGLMLLDPYLTWTQSIIDDPIHHV